MIELSEYPLVSAIMPTRGRAGWAFDAVEMFRAQTYPKKELVVVDDRSEPSFPYGLRDPLIRYHVAGRIPIGGKRNMAVSLSSGEIIMHWDSDDTYTPDRMEHQVAHLIESGAEIVGYHIMPFVDADNGREYVYHGLPGYCIGVSQTYWRSTWEARPFPAINQDEDNQFMFNRRAASCDSEGRIKARIHGGNTCEKRSGINRDSKRWRLVSA